MAACTRLGFAVEHTRGRRVFAIELGSDALVDSLPGVRSGSAYVGSFDREEAVEDETIDFFASGHPLVEGVLAHFEDGLLGRVARLELQAGREPGEGLAAIYKDGADFDVVALDAARAPAAGLGGGAARAAAPGPARGRRRGEPRGLDGDGAAARHSPRSGARSRTRSPRWSCARPDAGSILVRCRRARLASASAVAVAVMLALTALVAYEVCRIPVQVSDSVGNLLQVQRQTLGEVFVGQFSNGAYVRPLLWAQIKVAYASAGGRETLMFKGDPRRPAPAARAAGPAPDAGALATGGAWPPCWRRWCSSALHTFDGLVREAFPINSFLTVALCVLAVLALADGEPAWWRDAAAAVILAAAILTLESGVLVAVAAVARAAGRHARRLAKGNRRRRAGARGLRRRSASSRSTPVRRR